MANWDKFWQGMAGGVPTGALLYNRFAANRRKQETHDIEMEDRARAERERLGARALDISDAEYQYGIPPVGQPGDPSAPVSAPTSLALPVGEEGGPPAPRPEVAIARDNAVRPEVVAGINARRMALIDMYREGDISPEEFEAANARLSRDSQKLFEQEEQALADMLAAYNQEALSPEDRTALGLKISDQITKMGTYDPNVQRQVVGRVTEDGSGVELALMQAGSDEPIWARTIPMKEVPDTVAVLRRQMFGDVTESEAQADLTALDTSTKEAALGIQKTLSEINKLESETLKNIGMGKYYASGGAGGANGGLTNREAQNEYIAGLDLVLEDRLMEEGYENTEAAEIRQLYDDLARIAQWRVGAGNALANSARELWTAGVRRADASGYYNANGEIIPVQ